MVWWKQTLIAGALLGASLVLWALYVPAASPLLARLGLPAAEGAAPSGEQPARGAPNAGASRGTRVTVARVTEADAGGEISAIGDGKALRSVSVRPLAPGRLASLEVTSGQSVKAGDLLALLDSDSEAIALDRAKLAASDAESTLDRIERLRGSGAATDVDLSAAQFALDKARLDIRESQLALDRRSVTAPISGTVGLLPVDAGNQVDTETVIATIDDRSSILVDFRVPERFAGRLSVGDPVGATALARPDLDPRGKIIALDSRVDPTSRTLLAQAAFENGDDHLRAGMSFAIDLSFRGDRYPAVDPLAIQWSGSGAFVWAARDNRAVMVPVRVIQRDSEQVLVSGDLRPGDMVITEGLQRLKPGAAVVFENGADTRTAGTGNDG